MVEMVLQTNKLPEPIFRLIHAEQVKVREANGEIHLIPINDTRKDKSILPILGMYADGKLTVDGYLSRKRKEKTLDR